MSARTLVILTTILSISAISSCGETAQENDNKPTSTTKAQATNQPKNTSDAQPYLAEDISQKTPRAPTPQARMRYVIVAFKESNLGTLYPREQEKALKMAQNVQQQWRAGGSGETLVRVASEDPDKNRNKGLATVLNFSADQPTDSDIWPRSRIPDVAARLFALEKNEVALIPHHPKTNPLGIWIIKRLD